MTPAGYSNERSWRRFLGSGGEQQDTFRIRIALAQTAVATATAPLFRRVLLCLLYRTIPLSSSETAIVSFKYYRFENHDRRIDASFRCTPYLRQVHLTADPPPGRRSDSHGLTTDISPIREDIPWLISR